MRRNDTGAVRETPQHSTPIKHKFSSPASSLSPVRRDFSADHSASHASDTLSFLRSSQSASNSPSVKRDLQSPHKENNFAEGCSVSNHEIHQRLSPKVRPVRSKFHCERDARSQEDRRSEELLTLDEKATQLSDSALKHSACDDSTQSNNRVVSPLETTTVQRQRVELELLIAELRDRDRELNEMVASHQRQLLAWEGDRQAVLNLSNKCAKLQGDLDRRSDQVRSVTAKCRGLKTELKQKSDALLGAQTQLRAMAEQHSKSVVRAKDLENVNTTLNESVKGMSTTLGELQAREEQLANLVHHKDKELVSASRQISEMIGKLQRLDEQYREVRRREAEGSKDVVEWKEKYAESRKEVEQLRGNLSRTSQEEEESKTELMRYKQQLELTKQQMMLAGERERRKDELLVLQKSKQERTDAELTHLRLLYERQQRDVSLLHLNLETAKHLLAKQRNPDCFNGDISFQLEELNSTLQSDVQPENTEVSLRNKDQLEPFNAENAVSLTSHSHSSPQDHVERNAAPDTDARRGGRALPRFSDVTDAEGEWRTDTSGIATKSSSAVVELFDESLYHALTINSTLSSMRREPRTQSDVSRTDVDVRPKPSDTTASVSSRLCSAENQAHTDMNSAGEEQTRSDRRSSESSVGKNSEMTRSVADSLDGSLYTTPPDFAAVVQGQHSFDRERSPGTQRAEAPNSTRASLESKLVQESGVVSVDVGKAGGAECTHSTEDPGPLTPVIQGPGSGQVASPCSTLARLLTESRIMVEQLEMNSMAASLTSAHSTSPGN